MGNIQASSNTPLYKQVIHSKPVAFAAEKPELAGAGALGAGVIVAEAARNSPLVTTALKKGVVPLAATGVAVFGASMVKDAIQNDWPEAGKNGDKTANFVLKTTAGTALAAGGVELAGRAAAGVSPLTQAAKLVQRVLPTETIAFGSLAAAGATVAILGARNIKAEGVGVGNTLALGMGATTATGFAAAALGGFEKAAPLADKIGPKGIALVGGASLGLGAYALAKNTVEAMGDGRSREAVITAVGATAAGSAALHVLGNATGVPALSNLGQKLFLKNPLLAGSITAVTLAGAGYYLYSQNQDEAAKAAQK